MPEGGNSTFRFFTVEVELPYGAEWGGGRGATALPAGVNCGAIGSSRPTAGCGILGCVTK